MPPLLSTVARAAIACNLLDKLSDDVAREAHATDSGTRTRAAIHLAHAWVRTDQALRALEEEEEREREEWERASAGEAGGR